MEERVFGGRYRAVRFIGTPGRMQAWEGVDQTTGGRVVLMTAEPSSDEDISRWTQRAQSTAAIVQSDVAPIEDWGEQDGVFYVVQQWVEGSSAAQVRSQYGPATADRIARWGAQIANALATAHVGGVVHGDLRPDDIVVLQSDDAILAGLGAPGTDEPFVLPADATPDAVHYLSPEQCAAGAATTKSDIYSLGAILYRLTTSALPFDAQTAAEVADLQINAVLEPPRRVNAAIPPSLEQVILRAMAKDPELRYTSAEEMRDELQRIGEGLAAAATAAMPALPQKRRVWPWIVLALVGVIILVLVGLWWLGYLGGSVVPNLAGNQPDQAASVLEAEGLVLGTVDAEQDYPPSVMPGTVFDQTPGAGSRVRKGTPVDVSLAGGALSVVPDVVGDSESQAIAMLQQSGFKLGQVTNEFSGSVQSGVVISQVPSGTAEAVEGTTIDLVVSQGIEQAQVPSVVGQTQQAATQTLQTAKFKVAVKQQPSDTVARGSVVEQAPAAGVLAAAGSTITIFVSSGPEPIAQVRVPDVVGLGQNAAIEELAGVGLVAQIQSVTGTTQNAGNVLGQSPSPGIQVAPNSRVTIRVAQAPPPATP
jgi:serine/threonine-protein kinase